jgi:hypothetical protein
MDSLDVTKRRNKLHQKLVEKLVRAHTNLVLRESLDDVLHHLLPWDIELTIDEPVDEPEEMEPGLPIHDHVLGMIMFAL